MNQKHMLCLEYLSNKMEANAHMCGKAICDGYTENKPIGSDYQAVGSAILGRLRYLGYVTRIPELNAWRITKEGREYLNRQQERRG